MGEGACSGMAEDSISGAISASGPEASAVGGMLFSACWRNCWLATSGCGDHGGEAGFMCGLGATGGGILCFTLGDCKKLQASAPKLR